MRADCRRVQNFAYHLVCKSEVEPICFEMQYRTMCRILKFHDICQGMATWEVLVLECWYGAVGEVCWKLGAIVCEG